MRVGPVARVVVARSARHHAARRLPRAAGRCGARSAGFEVRVEHRVRRRDARRAPTRAARTAGSTSRSSTAYTRLHELGWAHSVETWRDGELAGGLYGVRIGRFFAGESMFHRVTDASKVACWATVELLRLDGATLFDVQWTTPHLRSLGAVDVGRDEYLRLLASAVMEPVQIFHNPSCSKSRGALQILEERGVDANVVRYLDTPPDRATLERILDAITDEPIALVRTGDAKFKAAGLTKADVQTRAQVIDVLVEASRGDGAAGRVRRRPRRDRAPVGEGARPPRLRAVPAASGSQSLTRALATIFVGVTRTSSSSGTALRRPNCSARSAPM